MNRGARAILIAVLILKLFTGVALAGFNNLVKDVFPSGTMSNATASAIVKEQAAGHFVGGQISFEFSMTIRYMLTKQHFLYFL